MKLLKQLPFTSLALNLADDSDKKNIKIYSVPFMGRNQQQVADALEKAVGEPIEIMTAHVPSTIPLTKTGSQGVLEVYTANSIVSKKLIKNFSKKKASNQFLLQSVIVKPGLINKAKYYITVAISKISKVLGVYPSYKLMRKFDYAADRAITPMTFLSNTTTAANLNAAVADLESKLLKYNKDIVGVMNKEDPIRVIRFAETVGDGQERYGLLAMVFLSDKYQVKPYSNEKEHDLLPDDLKAYVVGEGNTAHVSGYDDMPNIETIKVELPQVNVQFDQLIGEDQALAKALKAGE